MSTPVVVPRFSLSMTSALISEWFQPDGASVGAGDPLFCVESDNVSFDVEASVAGVLRHRARAGLAYEPGEAAGVLLAIGERVPTELHPAAIPVAHTPAVSQPQPPQLSSAEPASQREAQPTRTAAARDAQAAVAERVVPLRRSRAGLPPPPPSHLAFDRASRPDFSDGGPFAVPGVEAEPAESPVTQPPVAVEPPHAPEGTAAHASTIAGTAQVAPAGPRVLTLGARISFAEARKLTAQLRKEWRVRSLAPDDIDVVARAFSVAIQEAAPAVPGTAPVLPISVVNGPSVRVPFGTQSTFRDAVEARCRATHPRDEDAPVEVVSFAEAGIDEPCAGLRAGVVMSLAAGAVHPWPHTGGVRPVFGPHISLVLAFDGTVVPVEAAAAVFTRLRELVESPYALLAA